MSYVDLSYLPRSDTDSSSSDTSSSSSDDRDKANTQQRQASRSRSPKRNEVEENTMCLKCKKNPIVFATDSCRCPVFCRTCAMKFASGGYCLVCGEFYRSFTRI